MSLAITLTLPVPPSTNRRLRPAWNSKKKMFYRTNAVKDYRRKVRDLLFIQKIRPISGDVWMSIEWYRQKKSGDIPDRWKDVCDVLQADRFGFGAYFDDKQIQEFSVRRRDDDRSHPRIIVKIGRCDEENG